MRLITQTIKLTSKKPIQLIDITKETALFVQSVEGRNGIVIVASTHTTAAVKINEKCEKLEEDLKIFFKKLAPPGENYNHNHQALDGRNNAHSHLINYLLSRSETITVKDQQLLLGPWQTLFFVELDGPRHERLVHLTFLGE